MNIINESDGSVLHIREFDARRKLASAINVVIFGQRRVGKTTLLCDLVRYRKSDDHVYISNEDEDYSHNPIITNIVPKMSIHTSFDDQIISNITHVQRRRHKSNIFRHVSVMLDDCLYDKDTWTDKFRQLFCNSRCFRCSLFITAQYPFSIPAGLQQSVDYIFISRLPKEERFYQLYGDMFPGFDTFLSVYDKIIKAGYWMVIDNRTCYRIKKLEDRIFYYKIDHPLHRAVTTISRQWRSILNKRRLIRLKIGNELLHYPKVGIKYFEALQHFNHNQKAF